MVLHYTKNVGGGRTTALLFVFLSFYQGCRTTQHCFLHQERFTTPLSLHSTAFCFFVILLHPWEVEDYTALLFFFFVILLHLTHRFLGGG